MSLNSIHILIISIVEIEEESRYTKGVYRLSNNNNETKEVMSETRVEIVTLDRETSATLSVVERDQFSREKVLRDGKVPFYTSILPVLRGNRVTVGRVYRSIINTYGEGSISRMRVYKWLNSLVSKNLATKEFNQFIGEDEYIVK